MKKFVIKTIVFFLPLVLLFFLIERSVRNNTFKAKAEYIHENIEGIEAMILGSSQNWRAVNPEFLNINVAPLAHGGSAINIDFLLFEKFVELLPNLKVVIFELGYHNLEDSRDSDWSKNHLLHIYYGINNYDTHPPLKDNFLLTANIKQYTKRFITSEESQEFGRYNKYGFITDSPYWLFESLEYDSLRIEKGVEKYLKSRHKKTSKQKYLEHTEKLQKVVEQCLKNNISVVFLSPPKHYTYNKNMVDGKLLRRDEFVQSYNKHKNVHFWNFEKIYEYQSEMFGNPDHLNARGAKFFSDKIDSLLRDLINTNAQQRLKRQ